MDCAAKRVTEEGLPTCGAGVGCVDAARDGDDDAPRVLNADEIDSLLGYDGDDYMSKQDRPGINRPFTRWETIELIRVRLSIFPLGWRAFAICKGLLDQGMYGIRLGPISIAVYWPWHDPSTWWD